MITSTTRDIIQYFLPASWEPHITFHGGTLSHSLKSPLFQTMNISTMSEVHDIITNTTSMKDMTKSSSSNIFDLYMQNRSIGEPYYSGLDHVAFSITE